MESDLATPHIELPLPHEKTAESEHLGADSRLKLGISAARSGDRALARTLLTEVTDEDPGNAEAWLWLASISDYPEELLGFLNNVLEIDPNNKRALQWKAATGSLLSKTFVQRGIAAGDEGNTEFAEECFDSAITNDPRSEAAWFWKSTLAHDDFERIECLGRVLKINPEHTDAQKAQAEITHRQNAERFLAAQTAAVSGSWETAGPIVDQLLESDAFHVAAWTLRSHFSTSVDEKITAFDRLLEIDPDNSWAQSGKEFLASTVEAVQAQRLSKEGENVDDETTVLDAAGTEQIRDAEISSEPLELLETPTNLVDSDAPELVRDWRVSGSESKEVAAENVMKSTESSSDPIAETEKPDDVDLIAAGHDGDLDPEPAEEVFLNGAESEAGDFVNEPIANRLAAEFAAQVTDERIHEFLTEDAVSLPAGFDFEPKNASDETDVPLESATDGNSDDVVFLDSSDEPDNDEITPLASADDVNAQLATFDEPFATENDGGPLDFAQTNDEPFEESLVATVSCPYCSDGNDPQAFQCQSCNSVLSLSDIDSLLGERDCNRERILQAVTQMEAEWNLREFDEVELTTLAIGYFNLKNPERGLAYLQEASRLNPNDVILAGQVNALAIRLEEMRRQTETHEGMPKGKTILVVDDSATVRKLISSKLEKSGHKVVTAVDGIEAIELLDNLVPDLVLLDIAMPRMDGYSVCKLIRANESVKSVPVVMISGKDGFFDKVRGRMAGTTGYVTKPFGPETLMRALETYLVPDVQTAAE